MPRWVFWTAATMTSWGVWAVLGKVIGDRLTGAQSQALSTVGIMPVVLALAWSKDLAARPSGRRGMCYALAAGVVSGLGNVPFYDLLARGETAATAVSLTALYPVVTIALAAVLLDERVNRVQAVGLILALAAIYLFNVSEEGGILSGWLAYAFLPMALWGTAGFLSKLATAHLSGKRAALLLLIGFLLTNVGLLAYVKWPESVPLPLWGLVVALGFFLAFGNYTVVLAYAGGKASVITPLAGLYPLVSVPVAVLLLDEKVGPRTAAGIGCALLAVLALSFETPPGPAAAPDALG
jgi:drug/metabolite transporter (DMT)-like permease